MENDNTNVTQKKQTSKFVYNMYDFVSVIVSAVVVIFLVFTFVTRVLVVSGDSMLPTLQNKNSVAISSMQHKFSYGDIVIITQPNALHKTLIKRVIAVGGQTVDIDEEAGLVYVDGEPLREEYTLEPTYIKGDMEFPVHVPEGYVFVMGEFPVHVPEGYVFVMGDNRNDSTDSRMKVVGLIDERYIMGKVLVRISPFGQWKVD